MEDSIEQEIADAKPVPVQRFTWILLVVWTLLMAGLSFDEIQGIRQITHEMAVSEIRAYFNKDRALRVWSASHGGVYVPIDSRTPPSPYLGHVPERDLITPSGKRLTLMNPAYMIRQLSEDFSSLYGIVARITSLQPLRPENAPDAWERGALEDFEKHGLGEKLELAEIGGVLHLRLMQPVFVSPDCLACHAHQGYKIGDIRGGISIGLPMAEPLRLQQRQIVNHLVRAGLIWVTGLTGLLVGGRILRNRIAERNAAEDALRRSRDRLAEKTSELAEANSALTREVAERKKAEAEILISEEKFRTVADFTYDWEYWLDPAGNYLYISPSVERITGYTPADFKENPDLGMEIMHPDHIPQMKNHLVRAMNDRKVCMMEFRIISREGKERWIGHTCQPVFNAAGEFLGRRASNRDITGSKWTEKVLNKYAIDLAHSNKDLQDFAYMASHDLREPLVLIQAFSERLSGRYGEMIPERGLEYLKRIDTATTRMQELISGMLTYSRVTTKVRPFEEVDLKRVVLEVITDLELRVKESGARIEVGELCRIKADPLQIRQLFQNLIANALKYRRPDIAPLVTISCEHLSFSDEDGLTEFCRFIVADNGIGFEGEDAEQIFGLFQRLHGRSQYEGTGIGLAVCKRIVERHGGVIGAESSPGLGSRFIITLPINGPVVDESQTQCCGAAKENSCPPRSGSV
ncbi:ATP-binding protein [Thiovibrio sp. JS02]